jgi:opacity protein-like surface antigen
MSRSPAHLLGYLVAILVTATATTVVEPSIAAGKSRKTVRTPAAAPFSWTGWYVGGNVGYGSSSAGTIDLGATGSTTGLFPTEAPYIVASQLATLGPLLSTNPSGFLGGVQTGYNYQHNWLVFGIEADYAWANIAGSSARTLHSEFNIPGEPGFGVTTNTTGRERLNSLATLRVRAGITPTEHSLLYVTGGPAFGHVRRVLPSPKSRPGQLRASPSVSRPAPVPAIARAGRLVRVENGPSRRIGRRRLSTSTTTLGGCNTRPIRSPAFRARAPIRRAPRSRSSILRHRLSSGETLYGSV